MNGQLKQMEVFPLHEVPHLIKQCCDLLNMEWKRSEVARLRSVMVSCDELPMCLVLVLNEGDSPNVIGHSKLTRIPSISDGCFVESVVIHPNFRKKGLGRYLMNKSEYFAKRCGFTCMYLSTHDQQIFYGKLGYSLCPPVSIYGSAIPRKDTKEKGLPGGNHEKLVDTQTYAQRESLINNSLSNLPPPPPPPLPIYKKTSVPKKEIMFDPVRKKVLLKYDLSNDNFIEADIEKKQVNWTAHTVKQAYEKKLPLDNEKIDHLKYLCENHTIPESYWPFYKSIVEI